MTKTNYPALLGTLAITAGLLGGGAWYINKTAPNLLGRGGTSSQQTGVTPRNATQITLLGDTFSGYSTFRNEAFQTVLADTGLTLTYGDEFDQTARAEALNQGNADIIVTTLDQYVQQQPQGKIVGLIDRTIGAGAVVFNTLKYPELTSLLEFEPLLPGAPSQAQPL